MDNSGDDFDGAAPSPSLWVVSPRCVRIERWAIGEVPSVPIPWSYRVFQGDSRPWTSCEWCSQHHRVSNSMLGPSPSRYVLLKLRIPCQDCTSWQGHWKPWNLPNDKIPTFWKTRVGRTLSLHCAAVGACICCITLWHLWFCVLYFVDTDLSCGASQVSSRLDHALVAPWTTQQKCNLDKKACQMRDSIRRDELGKEMGYWMVSV